MVVYSPNENEYTHVGREIAADRGDELVDTLDDLGDEDVIYVDSPGRISEDELLALQRRLLEKGPETGGFGVVTGYTADHARDLYYRDEGNNGTDVLLSRRPHSHSLADESTVVLDGEEMTVDRFEALQEAGRLRSFCLKTRGWTMHLKFAPGSGFLCGYPRSVDPDDFGDLQPYCVGDDGMECPFDEPLMHAEDVDASHAFVSSCASMIDNDHSGLPVHVGMGLLGSVKSLVGSYKASPTLDQEMFLHQAAFRSGYSAVERCYLLNENAHALEAKAYPYVPFGKPRHAIAPTTADYEVDYRPEGETLLLEFHDVDAYLLDVTVPRESFESDTGEYHLRDATAEPNDRLQYSAFPTDDGVRVLVFAGDRITADRLRFRLDDRPADYEKRQLLGSYLRDAETSHALGIFGKKGRRQLRNLQDNVRGLATTVDDERYDPNAYRHLSERTAELLHHARQIRDPILEAYHTRPSLAPLYTYSERMIATDTYPSGTRCPNCDRRLHFVEATTFDGTVGRLVALCPMEGTVYDVPAGADDDPPSYLRIRGDLVGTGERRRTMTVAFENPRDHPVEVAVVPFLPVHPGGQEAQTELFDPLLAEATLGPGESMTADVEIDTGPLVDGQYILNAYVLANLELYFAGTMMTVGEASGFVAAELRT